MTGASPATPRPQPASVPVLRRALVVGGLFVLALAVLGTVVGGIAAGREGAVGALLGAIVGGVMVLLTAASILVANRLDIGGFFAVVLGTWLAKFVLFVIAALVLRGQPWLDSTAMFVTIIVAVLGSLVIDVLVVSRSRLPNVSDIAR
ncbi:hypothetical protein C5C31_01205 [Rathayibacter rathayi]|uniref:3-oxoacyl-ACP reductase n=1 Tax=Rathayibacter rathayi TaxID=33887 RepID=A0ABD6WCT3_RATRA|nr:hypothetical protein [Rathayibacter rathayi]AZZ49177.1 hypothetical protein C1O28_08170 [Rathayibacter rathayi]MWV73237.1 hypothetical protein [Rathayibacter rathayi NCPPB 2980 = VKM Ac-1601]PPF16327.1 hypothetical protein C5C04_00655 [Rathayibacter rathayi]PPF25595.1 hypothetical protein C5C34_01955 [Rathayibacter rathayi]PPF51900.1 hypothetical protein C5C08_00660 [Rathayibacter rathayi]